MKRKSISAPFIILLNFKVNYFYVENDGLRNKRISQCSINDCVKKVMIFDKFILYVSKRYILVVNYFKNYSV